MVRQLFLDYRAWFETSFDHVLCFEGFDEELASLPGGYAPPEGGIWLAENAAAPQGIVALKFLDKEACEMKRLWVCEAARGAGLGRRLVELSCAEARALGYRRMRLETLETMTGALALYRAYGFRETSAYFGKARPGVRYFDLRL